MKKEQNILLAFYGDDFTGSTDALEWLCRAGLKTMLFIEPPTVEQLRSYNGLQAFGIAGATRSMNPAEMEAVLEPAFEQLKQSGARHIHYKVCSTFDSSPTIGSIGKAIDVGRKVVNSEYVAWIQSAPVLGRYCFFGNLFARMGIGSNGEVFRLDRHPSMMHHPTTPADESDLRLVLGKQTKKKIGMVSILDVIAGEESIKAAIKKIKEDQTEVILFDALENQHLEAIAEVIDEEAEHRQLFSIGSSGVEMALGNYWKGIGKIKEEIEWQPLLPVKNLLVISGSCSPITAGQIDYALINGFEEIIVSIQQAGGNDDVKLNVSKQASELLSDGKSLIIHTGQKQGETISSVLVGDVLGTLAKLILEEVPLQRIVIAGGDTSSHTAKKMGIEALEMIAPFVSGAPMCKVYSSNKSIDGLEINLKGGQVGADDYFVRAAVGE